MEIYQLKISLKDASPPIWRRVLVPANTRLDALHIIIQIAMGWENEHLYSFCIDGACHNDEQGDLTCRLDQLGLDVKSKFSYVYDFGDHWEHTIVVEKTLPRAADTEYPVCLTGRKACPPEDCGGNWGYQSLLGVLAYPDHPDYEHMREWVDDSFEPETFDRDETNRCLRAYSRHGIVPWY